VPTKAIMDVLGHSEIGVTMNTYTHVLMRLREGRRRRNRRCARRVNPDSWRQVYGNAR
jgi:integrase